MPLHRTFNNTKLTRVTMQKTIKLYSTISILVSITILTFSAASNIVSATPIIPGTAHPKANLKIITSVINRCVPKTICNAVGPDSFHIDVFALGNSSTNWKYESLGQGFPGSSAGWTIDLVPCPKGIQYKVAQYRPFSSIIDSLGIIANTSYSDNCLGNIRNAENKTCTISNVVTNPQAYLKIITSVINHCIPKAVCDVIGPDNFRTNISGIVINNKEASFQFPLGSTLPGSSTGWVTASISRPIRSTIPCASRPDCSTGYSCLSTNQQPEICSRSLK